MTTPTGPDPAAPSLRPLDSNLSRRQALKAAAIGAGLASLAGLGALDRRALAQAPGTPAASPPTPAGPRRVSRLAHFTDSHIRPEYAAVEGVAAAFRHLHAQPDQPSLVLLGGDMIMFSMDKPEALVADLWKLWTTTLASECKLPVAYCLGNHDVWGWDKPDSKTNGSEPRWGKKWWSEITQQPRTYRAFMAPGSIPGAGPSATSNWKIIILDSIQPFERSYEGRIDDEQFAWLEGELAATPPGVHVCVVSHIPIWSIGMLACDARPISIAEAQALAKHPELGRTLGGSRAGMGYGRGASHMDAHRLTALFTRFPSVKLALSGHIHIAEQLTYQGVTYICNGAVSGAWWRGPAANKQRIRDRARPGDLPAELRPDRAQEGYALLDLYDDGSFRNIYLPFNWTPRPNDGPQ
jgi:Icc protein